MPRNTIQHDNTCEVYVCLLVLSGDTCAHLVAAYGKGEALQQLVGAGANINPTNKVGACAGLFITGVYVTIIQSQPAISRPLK